MVDLVRGFRAEAGLAWAGYDVVVEGDSTGEFVSSTTLDQTAWAQAGTTWWVESWWSLENTDAGRAELRRAVQAGPPS